MYDGPYVDAGPEVVVDQRPGVHVNDGIGGGTIQSGPDRWAAENTPYGIFAASGPDFEPQGELDRISFSNRADGAGRPRLCYPDRYAQRCSR